MSTIGVETLESRIRNVIDVHRDAEDVSNAEVIGVLEMMKLEISNDVYNEEHGIEPPDGFVT